MSALHAASAGVTSLEPFPASTRPPSGSLAADGAASPVGGTVAAAAEAAAAADSGRFGWQPSLRMDRDVLAAITASQSIVALTQWRSSGGLPLLVRIQPAAICAFWACLVAFILAKPRTYWRLRALVLPAWAALILGLFPSFRSTGVGTALVLEQLPRAGIVGAAMDLLRVLGGVRTLPPVLWTAFVPLPPTSTLALRVALMLWTTNAPAYCGTLLLSAPLTRQRQAAAARLLELAFMPLAAVQPVAGRVVPSFAVLEGEAPSEAVCQATLNWLQLVVSGLAPVLVGMWSWQPPLPAAAEEPEDAAGGSSSGGSSIPQRAQRLAKRAVAASDGWLHLLLGGTAGRSARAVLAWYVLGNCWLLCKISAGL